MKPILRTALSLTLAMLAAVAALAQEPPVFETLEQEMRFAQLTAELRCTVCQNQNLADSDAQLTPSWRRICGPKYTR
jgi:cytochrome c-type biogenesis protein CcmH